MQRLDLDLGERSYPIYIGADLLTRPELITQHCPGSSVVVVSNETVAPLYLARVLDSLSGRRVSQVILPDGEQYKDLAILSRIYDLLIDERHDRRTTLIALGGGVVGDITGFAAATYQRGVNYIQLPTTLLAQVDSSVGGKTAVNHPGGKNMIGAFHQPRCVVADTTVLSTLEERQLRAGIAEVIKYGLIRDPEFLSWLEGHVDRLLIRDDSALTYAIERSCRNKAEVVAADERESGQRALLNLGHTFGHAIEAGVGYGEWLHGEAVGAGMAMAARFSSRLGMISEQEVRRVEAIIRAGELPIHPPAAVGAARMLELMAVDKKVADGVIRLVLLEGLGDAVISRYYSLEALRSFLADESARGG